MPSVANAEFRHFNEWTNAEKTELAVYASLSYIDYRQTSWAMKQRNESGNYMFIEMNPLYGERPSDEKLMVGQLIGLVGYYWFIGNSNNLPQYHFAKGILLGAKLSVVIHHENIGISLSRAF